MIALALVAALAALGAAPPPAPDGVRMACPATAEHCYGLRVHLTGPTHPADDAAIDAWVEHADQLFAAIGVAFEVLAVAPDAHDPHVASRADRDALGHSGWQRGVIDVYVVDRLDDIDLSGHELRGVHWRDRAQVGHRWVILSRIAPPHVLAHELGHFFSLPHSSDPLSLMNKTPRDDPPMEARRFTDAEETRMRAADARMRKDHTLADRVAKDPTPPR